MTTKRKILKTIIWFIKRPRYYIYLLSELYKRLFKTKLKRSCAYKNMQEAENWCNRLCVDTNTALGILTGEEALINVRSLYIKQFEAAERIIRNIPEIMGGPGDLNLIYWIAEHLKAKRIIETGVAYGWSSLVFLLSLNNRRDMDVQLISTDRPEINQSNDLNVGCVVPKELNDMWYLLRSADRQGLPKAIKMINIIDMCHYDSDKSYEGRMWAYPLLWKALRPGGFFISDDIGNNTAFMEFSELVECKPIIVKNEAGEWYKHIGVLVKP